MARQLDHGIFNIEDVAGAVMVGAKLFFYAPGTTTPQATYSDQALSTPNANPVVADATGRFGPIWLAAVNYKIVLKTAADVTLVTRDPINTETAADTTFLQAGTGAVARSQQDKSRERKSAADFRLGSDPDDTLSILRAKDSFGAYAGIVEIGGLTISDTILIEDQDITLQSQGWGRSNQAQKMGFIKWNGAAGIPMIKLRDMFGGGVEHMRIIGNSAAKPSCAIEINRDDFSQMRTRLNRLWIGSFVGLDTDDNNQFTDGIRITGTVDGDACSIDDVSLLKGDGIALDVQNPNASGLTLKNFKATVYAKGIRNASNITGLGINIYGCTTTDLETTGSGRFFIKNFQSEGSARMLILNGALSGAVIDGGRWQVGTSGGAGTIHADGYFIDRTDAALSSFLILKGFFELSSNPPFVTPVPKIRFGQPTPGLSNTYNEIGPVRGIWPVNLDYGTMVWTNDSRRFLYNNVDFTNQDPGGPQRLVGNYDRIADRTFRYGVNQDPGELSVFGGPFNLRRLLAPVNVTAVVVLGSGATAYNYKVTALTWDGETDPSLVATVNNNAVLSASATNKVAWNPTVGARAYNIYKDVAGTYLLVKTMTYDDLHPGTQTSLISPYSWTDNGSLTPSGAIPVVNTTGNAVVEGALQRTAEDTITAFAGGGQAGARKLTAGVSRVTVVATAADSVRLPPAVAGDTRFVTNRGANSMQVFGAGTDTINDVATATGVPQAAGVEATYACCAAGKWDQFLGA